MSRLPSRISKEVEDSTLDLIFEDFIEILCFYENQDKIIKFLENYKNIFIMASLKGA